MPKSNLCLPEAPIHDEPEDTGLVEIEVEVSVESGAKIPMDPEVQEYHRLVQEHHRKRLEFVRAHTMANTANGLVRAAPMQQVLTQLKLQILQLEQKLGKKLL